MRPDILFIHEGRSQGLPPICLPPMGLLALAGLLRDAGYSTLICNAAVERALDTAFDPVKFAASRGAKIICLDLHWHQQSFAVLELAAKLKAADPALKIVLGGFTATYFHKEILDGFPAVDFVVRGDGEKPLLELCRALLSGKNAFGTVPNLSWRDGKTLRANKLVYCADEKSFAALSFAEFELCHNWKRAYPSMDSFYRFKRGQLDSKTAAKAFAAERTFYYNCGRGCTHNCVFCGGGKAAHALLCHRKGVLVAPQNAALRQLVSAAEHGFKRWHTDFFPDGLDSYYEKLFCTLRRRGVSFDTVFGCWHLPDAGLVKLFAKTFGKNSRLEVSPETGSEALRLKTGRPFFTNSQLAEFLTAAHREGVRCAVHFTVGLPWDKPSSILETLRLLKFLKRTFSDNEIVLDFVEVEPAAPWHLAPGKAGIKLHRRTFADFYAASAKPETAAGYSTEFLREDAILMLTDYLKKVTHAPRRPD